MFVLDYKQDHQVKRLIDSNKQMIQVISSIKEKKENTFTDIKKIASPYFYSTCYISERRIEFEGIPPPPKTTEVAWRYASNACISCEDQTRASFVNNSRGINILLFCLYKNKSNVVLC